VVLEANFANEDQYRSETAYCSQMINTQCARKMPYADGRRASANAGAIARNAGTPGRLVH
jgi:hypothetical protein